MPTKQTGEVHLGRLVQGFQGGPLIFQPQHFLSEALQLILCCCCLNLPQHILFPPTYTYPVLDAHTSTVIDETGVNSLRTCNYLTPDVISAPN